MKPLSEEQIKKRSESHRGKNAGENHYPKQHNDETKKKISETLKILYATPESNPNFGKPMPEHVKRILLESHIGKHHSEETKMKMSKSHNGHPVSEEQKRKIGDAQKGEKNHLFGKHHSEEHKRKISEGGKGKLRSIETRKKISEARKGIPRPKEMCQKISGNNHYLWKGGTSFAPYCEKFNNYRRRATRNFFNGLCITCGSHSTELRRNLSVHHIEHDKEQGCNGKPFNLVPLCQSCHSKELHDESDYKSYINHTLEEGFKWGIWNREQYDLEVMYPEQSEVEMMITETTTSIPAGV